MGETPSPEVSHITYGVAVAAETSKPKSEQEFTLRDVWTYPVKSMTGHTVASANLTDLGIAGDRYWALRSLEIGGIRGAKKIGKIMQFSARETVPGRPGEGVEIVLPDGSVVSSGQADVNERLSTALGHRVELQQLPANTDASLDHFRRGPATSDDAMRDLRDVFGREDGEPLPDFSAFPPVIAEFESPPGTHYDCWPLMIMTTSALHALRDALPGSNTDIHRFRPSLVVDTGDTPGHPEFSWTGRRARIGDEGSGAVVEFLSPCPRCVMTTREVRTGPGAGDILPADRAILRHIVRDLDQNLGVYAQVVSPGTVRAGDRFTFL